MTSALARCFHVCWRATPKARSIAVSGGFGLCCFKTATCWRSAKFSRARSARDLKSARTVWMSRALTGTWALESNVETR